MNCRKTKSAPHIPPLMSDQTKYQATYSPLNLVAHKSNNRCWFFCGSGSMLVLVDKRRSFSHPDLKEGKIKSHYFVDLMRKKKAFLVVYVCNKL